MRYRFLPTAAALMLLPFAALAGTNDTGTLTVKATGITEEGLIEPNYAFCIAAQQGHMQEGPNRSIGLEWSAGPPGTLSYAILAVDRDVPADFTYAGKEGHVIAADAKRRDFYHWVLIDIPSDRTILPEGLDSQGVAKTGKSETQMPYGQRGSNDYAGYFASDPARQGIYAGYDGPCPPWNDERIHRYAFQVYALNVSKLGIGGRITGPDALKAMEGHVLAKGEVVGQYTLNPSLLPTD